jgi:hypothetical protein
VASARVTLFTMARLRSVRVAEGANRPPRRDLAITRAARVVLGAFCGQIFLLLGVSLPQSLPTVYGVESLLDDRCQSSNWRTYILTWVWSYIEGASSTWAPAVIVAFRPCTRVPTTVTVLPLRLSAVSSPPFRFGDC